MGTRGGPTDGERVVQHRTDELLVIVYSECFDFHATRPHDWPLCGRAKYVTAGASDYFCAAGRFEARSCKRAILSCSAALIARAGVRCTSCIGKCERTVSDYGVGSSHHHPHPPPPSRGEGWGGKASELEGVRGDESVWSVAAGGVSGDGCAGGGMMVVVACFVSFSMNASMTLSVDTMITLPCTEKLERLSVRAMTV